MAQKDIFAESEGNAWFRRNSSNVAASDEDPLLLELRDLPLSAEPSARVLEIGCGGGRRLEWLKQHRGCQCVGLDPASDAVAAARSIGIEAVRGTADVLPFGNAEFDCVIFGFCLYLCDRADLFRIAAEADRVLRDPGWLVILDFYSREPKAREYHHRPGLFSYKMDYRNLFLWHPAYTSISHKVRHHVGGQVTDDTDEWIATSVLRKRTPT